MSSAGNRGVFSNNGATNWNFNRGGSGAGTTDNTAGGSTAERRRSSGSSAQRFANLHNQKRNSSDMTAAARRASFADQSKAPGFLGGMWQNWTKGSGK